MKLGSNSPDFWNLPHLQSQSKAGFGNAQTKYNLRTDRYITKDSLS